MTWQGVLLDHVKQRGAGELEGWEGLLFELSPALGFARLPIGAPVAAVVIEEMAALGVRTVVGVGTAGSLAMGSSPGDTVICTAAVRDEGTSHHYLPSERFAHPDPKLVRRLREEFPDALCGPTWTTDAPYRETLPEIERFREEGVLTVEMEAAAIFTVSACVGIRAASVFCISDLLHDTEWKPHFGTTATGDGLRRTFDTVCNALDGF